MAVEYKYKIDGEQVTRAQFLRRSRSRRKLFKAGDKITTRGLGTTLRPSQQIVSESLACHPKDREAFEADAKKRGFNLHFDSEGRPTFSSFSQRDAYAKTQGFHPIRKRAHPL